MTSKLNFMYFPPFFKLFRTMRARQALASDLLRVPPNETPKLYPPTWSTFPVIHRSYSTTAVGAQPHWVAATLAQGRKDVTSRGKGWWESCFAVDVPVSQYGFTRGGSGSGQVPNGERGEAVEIDAMIRHSLPGARLLRLVRLQDRGRWLRFVCERDSAISSVAAASASSMGLTDGTVINSPPVGRFFADPRDVVSPGALSAMATPVEPTNKIGGRTVPSTLSEDSKGRDEGKGGVGGTERFTRKEFVAAGNVRCTKVARFAAVAFALPPGEYQSQRGEGQGEKAEETFENIRTVAVIRAVTGVSQERRGVASAGAGTVVTAAAPVVSAAGSSSNFIIPSASSAGRRTEDPFLGVDPSIDDLTRAGGISILPSAAHGVEGVLKDGGGAAAGNQPLKEHPVAAASLSSHAVHSVKTFESLMSASARGLRGVGERGGEGATTTVFEVRPEACYPEYLATFSFPPHAV